MFSTYLSTSNRDSVVAFVKGTGMGSIMLVGPNWIVNSQTAASLQPAMGGIVVSG